MKNKYVIKILRHLGDMCLFTSALRASVSKSHILSLPQNNLYVFFFVNCVFIFRIANTFVASYAMKYSEIFFVIRKYLAYTHPSPPPQLYMLATALITTTQKISREYRLKTDYKSLNTYLYSEIFEEKYFFQQNAHKSLGNVAI